MQISSSTMVSGRMVDLGSRRREQRLATSKARELLAMRDGPRRTLYGVRYNPDYGKAKSLGMASKLQPYIQSGTYVGEWVEDKKEGFGKQVWEHGAKYEGEFLAGKRHGRGTLWVLEGPKLRKRYSGDWVSGKRQGLGVAIGNGKTADIYEGEWYMNKRHGRGKMRYANGDVYEGEWHGGVRSGFGVLQKANGDRFEGQWLDGRKEGPGCYIFQDTNKVLEGEWTDDIAKTGEYRALEVRETRRHGLSSPLDFTLPVLTVADPDLILEEAAAGERQLRKGRRRAGDFTDASDVWADCGRRTPVFTRRQIAKLREHFESFVARSADKEGNRGRQIQLNLLPEMLGGLGQEISENEFSMLMHHIGADPASFISFADFVDIVSTFFE
uniref:MORN repeat-containing protein 3 n=1 Tax=Pinguiococcus pyrenoidosus TaxID=172671 RepID=A0A7R9U9L5_9STRA|mmetsp:Transcript_2387/g.10168  ORF Transcript_2387/g.10168 Transcript_2387/m.10168 type:complete len:384 (+) Transcript_2387:184-1335(+)